jgi:hypothetical protein
MSRAALVEAYLEGEISRRVFVRRLVASGLSLGAAVAYAEMGPGAGRAWAATVEANYDSSCRFSFKGTIVSGQNGDTCTISGKGSYPPLLARASFVDEGNAFTFSITDADVSLCGCRPETDHNHAFLQGTHAGSNFLIQLTQGTVKGVPDTYQLLLTDPSTGNTQYDTGKQQLTSGSVRIR